MEVKEVEEVKEADTARVHAGSEIESVEIQNGASGSNERRMSRQSSRRRRWERGRGSRAINWDLARVVMK